MFEGPSTNCQSCGLPIEDGKYGTNPDETYNWDYCNRCYDEGEFLEPTIQMEELIDRSARKIEEDTGIPEDDAKEKLKKLFPTLKRWNETW